MNSSHPELDYDLYPEHVCLHTETEKSADILMLEIDATAQRRGFKSETRITTYRVDAWGVPRVDFWYERISR
jgi:hypothetical protein